MNVLKMRLEHFLQQQFPCHKNLRLVRKWQSLANVGGQLCGWTDPKITIQGRHDAFELSQTLAPHIAAIDGFFSSDLHRCTEFADIALNFNGIHVQQLLTLDRRLWEIKFGDDEGLCYDTMSLADKTRIDSYEYKAPNGESWKDVRHRFVEFVQGSTARSLMVFTHGGLICSLTFELGLENVVRPGSVLAVKFEEINPGSLKVEFVWEPPLLTHK